MRILNPLFTILFCASLTSFGQGESAFISVDELRNESQKIFLFDVSKDSVYESGHIDGALHLSRADFSNQLSITSGLIGTKDQLENLLFQYGIQAKDRIVLYDHKGGCEAARLYWILRYYGHEKIQLLDGGYAAWQNHKANFRVPENLALEDKYIFKNGAENVLASKEDVRAALNDENTIIVDTRTLEEYEGTFQKDGASRPGRIPGSVHIDWVSNINYEGDQKIKSIDELKQIYEAKGVTSDKNVIVYCHSGTRSSHSYIVLTAVLGYENVSNYDGSWIEWSADENLAVETGVVSPLEYATYGSIFVDTFSGYYDYIWNQVTFQANPWYENYFWFLVILSLLVWLLEIVFPWRKNQAIFRKDFWLDFFFMFFNFYIFNLIIFLAFSKFVTKGFYDISGVDLTATSVFDMSGLAWGWQMLIFFLATDFIQWVTHVALHRFDFLWRFHKVHHSVEEMGFAAHLRYHWMETIFYTPMKFLAVMFIGGFAPEQAFMIYFFTIAIGHINHANLNISYGPLKYILNNPKMHIWHHAKTLPKERRYGVNFGITLSIWDYIFRKNYIPESGRDIPLGFANIEKYPKRFFGLIFSGFGKTPDEKEV